MKNIIFILLSITLFSSCQKERNCVCEDGFVISITKANKKTQETTCDVWTEERKSECIIENP